MRILCVLLLLAFNSNAQIIGGDLKASGRKLVSKPDFEIEGSYNGYKEYELAVDIEGNVTGARVISSNIKSTPAGIAMKNHAMKFKFERGTHYPKFHHVLVRITMVKVEQKLEGLDD